LAQHPNDIPGVLTRAEIWGRISIGILIGVSLAVAKTNSERAAGLSGLGECENRDFIRAARDQGWNSKRSGSHMTFYPKDKSFPPIVIGLNKSDWRANKNKEAHLRRAGLKLDC
jgi:hypothetical protein